MRRVAIYARVSKAERDDPTSVPVQLADCRRRADDEGWEIVDIYRDEGISAWNPRRKRPEFERLLADLDAGRFDTVLVREQERLLRQLGDTKRVQDLADAGRLKLIAATMESDINFARARDRDDFRKRASQAQFYSDFLSEKVRATKAVQAARGEYTGGEKEPFGYGRTDGQLVVDLAEAKLVHEAVSRLGKGESMHRIVRDWNHRGIVTSRGGRWRPGNLTRTLLGEHLIGAKGFPRILSDEEAAVVRGMLATTERKAGRPSGIRAPLAGYLRCGECGSKMTTGANYYRCSVSHGGCGGASITMVPLERYVLLESLRQWLEVGRPDAVDGAAPAETSPLIEELRALEAREEEIASALASGELTTRIAGEATRKVEARRRELTEALARALPPPEAEPLVTSLVEVFTPAELVEVGLERFVTVRNFDAALPFREASERRDPEAVAQVRDLYNEVLDHATVSRRQRRGRGFDPARVAITWQ